MKTTVLAADRVVTPDSIHEPGWVRWSGEIVLGVGGGAPPRRPDLTVPGATVVPGFVDTHVHGGGGASFGSSQEDARTAAAAHIAHGTTTLVASLVTATPETLERSVKCLAELVQDDVLAGIHLEGPWLSPARHGAHDRRLLRTPDDEVQRLLDAGRGAVRVVTLAPELDRGMDAVRRVVDGGAVAAIGHTDATYAQTEQALASGATCGTHLFNAMRPVHHREPGPALALLHDDRAFVELIADGVHLHPAMIRAATTGRARPMLVTDAIAAAAAPAGDYRLGQLDVVVADGRAVVRGTDVIAGSTLTMDAALRFVVSTVRLPLIDAVRAASTTPADLLGRPDLGRLVAGARADLVILDADLHPRRVLRRGAWISDSSPRPPAEAIGEFRP